LKPADINQNFAGLLVTDRGKFLIGQAWGFYWETTAKIILYLVRMDFQSYR
jgi:hypothetical protein